MKQIMKNAIAMIAVFTVIVCLGFTGCAKDAEGPSTGGSASEEANSFNFSMTKSVQFAMKYDVPTGYRVHFEMYSKSPLTLDEYKSYVKDSTLIPFFSGRTDLNGSISFKGELPAGVTEIYSYSTAIGVPVLMKASVSDEGVVSEFKVAKVEKANSTRANGNGASGTSSWKAYSVTLNKPVLPAVSMVIPESDKTLIDKSFPEDQNYEVVKSYYRPSIQLNEKATVKIYSVKHGANSDRINALAYFVYQNDDINPEDVNSNLQLAFPELSKTIPAEGAGYQLLNNGQEEFEAGSRIGFALFPDITPNNIATNNIHLLYSYFKVGSWNTYSYPNNGSGALNRASAPHMVISLLRVDANGHAIIAIGFEDQPFAFYYGTNKGNFRDDIFIVEVTPASALPDLPTPPEEEPEYDAESVTSGIVCFEDSWPHLGDYDINDVSIAYERALCYSNDLGLVAMKEKFTFLNNGAAFINGFGYQLLGASQSNITKCTVESDYTCEGQGLDATAASNEAIIMLFDNGKSVRKGTTFTVNTQFSLGTLVLGINPFIVVRKSSNLSDGFLSQNRVEVHLPTTTKSMMAQFLPTSKANMTYFGQYADKSEPKKKIYYVRSGNYPFALDINWDASKYGEVAKFIIPREAKSIDYSYPDFTKWADSQGKTNKDWYLYPSPNI